MQCVKMMHGTCREVEVGGEREFDLKQPHFTVNFIANLTRNGDFPNMNNVWQSTMTDSLTQSLSCINAGFAHWFVVSFLAFFPLHHGEITLLPCLPTSTAHLVAVAVAVEMFSPVLPLLLQTSRLGLLQGSSFSLLQLMVMTHCCPNQHSLSPLSLSGSAWLEAPSHVVG